MWGLGQWASMAKIISVAEDCVAGELAYLVRRTTAVSALSGAVGFSCLDLQLA